jgi:hypothetical protein
MSSKAGVSASTDNVPVAGGRVGRKAKSGLLLPSGKVLDDLG